MNSATVDKVINVENYEILMELFGKFDENIRLVEEETGVKLVTRETQIRISGSRDRVDLAYRVIEKLVQIIKNRESLDISKVAYTIQLVKQGQEDKINQLMADIICVNHRGKQIRPKTIGQKRYIDAISKNDIVFGIGPAGTGKTYLAVAMAVRAYKNKQVSRIILTRPAVEAGEKLGFLPGDLQNKVDPYLRPLYDSLHDLMGTETYLKLVDRGTIEIAPLAYMRGRTLDDSFIILDEAQNTTPEQMKMFLTRIGVGSKAVVTGDVTQIDLPRGKRSGLIETTRILKNIKGLDFVYLKQADVVRHALVTRIIEAYDRYEGSRRKRIGERQKGEVKE